jgi:hypothetical protein
MSVLLVMAAMENLQVRRFDVCKAFLDTPSKTTTSIQPTKGSSEADEVVWNSNMTAYGLEGAAREFDDHFSAATVNLPQPFKRCVGDPTVLICESSSAIFRKHLDDALAIGTERDLDTFFAELEAVFAVKVFPPIEEEEQQLLGCDD